jgi:hypothetical protein
MPVFNLGMIGMTLFNEDSFPKTFHHLSLFITIVILLGAIHEVLNICIDCLHSLTVFIYKTRVKISNIG